MTRSSRATTQNDVVEEPGVGSSSECFHHADRVLDPDLAVGLELKESLLGKGTVLSAELLRTLHEPRDV